MNYPKEIILNIFMGFKQVLLLIGIVLMLALGALLFFGAPIGAFLLVDMLFTKFAFLNTTTTLVILGVLLFLCICHELGKRYRALHDI